MYNSKKIWHIDFLRGLAVIGMIVFHYFFILDFFNISNHEMSKGLWSFLGDFVRITFLVLVGLNLSLSNSPIKRKLMRGLKILCLGLIISVATYIFIPDDYIRFGILHLIGFSMVFLALIPNKLRFILPILFIGLVLNFAPNLESNNIILYILGLGSKIKTIDYFPIIPWINFVIFGMIAGNLLKSQFNSLRGGINSKIVSPVIFFGRRSLLIYMVHVPVIILLLFFTNEI